MKILFVWPSAETSVWDVARGHRSALARIIGENNIKDYYLNKHLAYHAKAIPEQFHNPVVLSRMASDNVICEAVYFKADWVLIISGLNFHPQALWGLKQVGIKAATLITESPYDDELQAEWASAYPEMKVFTTEKISARNGWQYLPHAYDPMFHYPGQFNPELECDVFMVGSGWSNRRTLLEAVDWTGINLKLYGIWTLREDSPLKPYYTEGMSLINNENISEFYASSKICLNIHRAHPHAESMNSRTYEIAGCGAFQICDDRKEVKDFFGDAVPIVSTAKQLEHEIRKTLANDVERKRKAALARERVINCTFDTRATHLLNMLQRTERVSDVSIECNSR